MRGTASAELLSDCVSNMTDGRRVQSTLLVSNRHDNGREQSGRLNQADSCPPACSESAA